MNTGLVALWFYRGSGSSIAKKPYFCDFLSGGEGVGVRTPLSPPLDPRMLYTSKHYLQNAHILDR